MHDDESNRPDPRIDPSPDRPATARSWARVFSIGVLALLMAGTSWVVASWVSAWLVPPYLILMALILLPSAGRPPGEPAEVDAGPSELFEPAPPAEIPDDPSSSEASPAPAGASGGTDEAAASPPTRGRRGKGKARKAKPVAEPVEATWIEVAPGKFVRSEAARPSAEVGPHDFVGVPSEVPATPRPQESGEVEPIDRPEAPGSEEASKGADFLPEAQAPTDESGLDGEPIEDAMPAFDLVEVREDDPTGDVIASGSPDAAGTDEGGGSIGFDEWPPAVDGNAPQAGGSFDASEDAGPIADLEAADDRAWDGAEAGGSGPVEPSAPDDLAPSLPPTWQGPTDLIEGPTARAETPEPETSEEIEDPAGWAEGGWAGTSEATDESIRLDDPEPPGQPAPPDAEPEPADELMVFEEGADPTETAVDETVLDDAGPSDDPLISLDDAPADDPLVPEILTGVPTGSDWWPRRLAPRARTRDGHDARAVSNVSPPRRPVRSPGPAHRPPDPRRLTRRGAGRPRQITRAFPPRSPPRGRIGRGSS